MSQGRQDMKRFFATLVIAIGFLAVGQSAPPAVAQGDEYTVWSNAVARDTVDAYRHYLRRFQDGLHASDVRQRLRDLGVTSGWSRVSPAVTQGDEYTVWSNAVARDTVDAYRDYLRRFQDGLHAADVRQSLRGLGVTSRPESQSGSRSTLGTAARPEKSVTGTGSDLAPAKPAAPPAPPQKAGDLKSLEDF